MSAKQTHVNSDYTVTNTKSLLGLLARKMVKQQVSLKQTDRVTDEDAKAVKA